MQMDFGTVLVTNTAVKEKLVATQRDLVLRLLKVLQTVPRDAMVAVARRYKELQAQLLQKPECLEDVDRQRRLIEDLPAKIQELAADAEAVQPWCGLCQTSVVPMLGLYAAEQCHIHVALYCWVPGMRLAMPT